MLAMTEVEGRVEVMEKEKRVRKTVWDEEERRVGSCSTVTE
jgi:hypothetical protein